MKWESEVETVMKQKNLNIWRRSNAASIVKSDGEPVTGATLRTAIDDGDDDDNDNNIIIIIKCLN